MRRIISYFIAICLIWIGIMLIVNSLNIDGFELNFGWTYIYPLFFIVTGVVLLGTAIIKRHGRWMIGTFLLVFGGLLLADRFGLVDFTFWNVFKLWPMILIFIGVSLFRGFHIYWDVNSDSKKKKNKKKIHRNKETSFTFGDMEKKGIWNLEPMNISTMVGSFYLDLTDAYIPDEETEINIWSLAGDVTILIPEEVEFQANAVAKAGDINILNEESTGINAEIFFETIQFESATKRLYIDIRLKAGSIRIDRV
ncbi:cell wall-active antibiotics response protein LiaF [Oceanobacillus jeddahense]|uniref:Cell wall-active antibiotics response protein LiaF n=1 Tax=Oceanobacillus jeddahense TaxID=1462527 RepID=A0ABY5JXY6_9BACI|nr:cell wall-active antibiotics response protein LiaF [Oceanobacillus jeddahense]UUI05181.1 cell wall-active antibiotics response protein LiaF [Oceanobacillus jeddahense]